MKRLIEKRYILRRNMLAVIGLCLSVYFSYHLIAGQRGYFRLMTLENKIASVSHEYEGLKEERQEIEKKVVMMRPGSIDRDLLEERARHVLGYRRGDEVILLQNRS
ncbi:MAG TPA: septum formation initiator family protein [Alphaproteobacteria bacterium]|nr:septum formation initiator family protein [Alphaproteobacteria bacterium]